MKRLFAIVFLVLLSGCYNKIVFIDVHQEGSETNELNLDKNTLDTNDSFEGDSQPVMEVPLLP